MSGHTAGLKALFPSEAGKLSDTDVQVVGDTSHELAMSLWAVSTPAWVLITDLKHKNLGKGSFAVTKFFPSLALTAFSLFFLITLNSKKNPKQIANRH